MKSHRLSKNIGIVFPHYWFSACYVILWQIKWPQGWPTPSLLILSWRSPSGIKRNASIWWQYKKIFPFAPVSYWDTITNYSINASIDPLVQDFRRAEPTEIRDFSRLERKVCALKFGTLSLSSRMRHHRGFTVMAYVDLHSRESQANEGRSPVVP